MVYKIKTQISNDNVRNFLETIKDTEKREDALILLEIFERISGYKAKMWWKTIIGFGTYHYQSKSGCEWDWMRTGFAPRAAGFSVYIMPWYELWNISELMDKLWKYKSWKSCLNIKKLSDIDIWILEKIIKAWLDDMKERYPE